MLEFRAALEYVVLRAKALLELLGGSVEHGGAESDRRQVWAGKLGAFLILSNVFETMINPPVHYPESLI
jgi:hypothetical protein